MMYARYNRALQQPLMQVFCSPGAKCMHRHSAQRRMQEPSNARSTFEAASLPPARPASIELRLVILQRWICKLLCRRLFFDMRTVLYPGPADER